MSSTKPTKHHMSALHASQPGPSGVVPPRKVRSALPGTSNGTTALSSCSRRVIKRAPKTSWSSLSNKSSGTAVWKQKVKTSNAAAAGKRPKSITDHSGDNSPPAKRRIVTASTSAPVTSTHSSFSATASNLKTNGNFSSQAAYPAPAPRTSGYWKPYVYNSANSAAAQQFILPMYTCQFAYEAMDTSTTSGVCQEEMEVQDYPILRAPLTPIAYHNSLPLIDLDEPMDTHEYVPQQTPMVY